MNISMNVPGYVQDAQHEYISLLRRPDVQELCMMAPYFSDDKIARALIVTANRLRNKLIKKDWLTTSSQLLGGIQKITRRST